MREKCQTLYRKEILRKKRPGEIHFMSKIDAKNYILDQVQC